MEKRLLVFMSILVLAITFLAVPQSYTGFTTISSSNIDLQPTSTKTAINSPLEGNLVLKLFKSVSPQEIITLTLNDQTTSYTIQQLLDLTNLTYEYESTEFNATNEAQQKSLTYTSQSSQYLGFKLPRYSEVTDLSFSLSASNNPKAVTMDFGNEGTIDWSFLGTFLNYNSNLITSTDFDSTQEGTGQISDNETYFCEFLTIPKTRNLNISTKFTKKSSLGDIYAIILSVPTGNPKSGWSGGSNTCDIPETKNSCTIELDYPIEGKYLICIYSSGPYNIGETIYEIPLDTSQETTTGYTCPTEEDGICQETTFSNFFIYLQTGNYNSTLSGNINIEDWETFTDSMITGVKYYVGSEPYNGICKSSMCTIPINITSQNSGDLLFKDLTLTYTYNGITQTSSTFYDLTVPQTNIYMIESETLADGTTITIPLEKLNIIPTSLGDYNFTASFLSETDSELITVKESSDIYDSKTLINTATTKYNTFLDDSSEEYKILSMLDKTQKLEQTIEDLNSYKNEIGFTEESTLLIKIEEKISNLPWIITLSGTSSDSLILEPQDIPSSLGDEESIYHMQESISIKATTKTIEIKNYNEEISTYYLIHQEITTNEDIAGAQLYEIAPTSFSDIYYTERPTTSSGTTATYDFTLSKSQTIDYYFLATEPLNIYSFKPIIVLNETTEETINYICGDEICKIPYEDQSSCPEDCAPKYPWLYIIIIITIAILTILIIIFKDKLKR